MKIASFILVIESYLVRQGLASLLSRIHGVRIVKEYADAKIFQQSARKQKIDFLVISQSLFDESAALFVSRPELLEKTILLTEKSGTRTNTANSIFLTEEKEEIVAKIRKLTALHPSTLPKDPSSELTQREKTIVRQVSLGMTNRQIAETLFIHAYSDHPQEEHQQQTWYKIRFGSDGICHC